MKGKFGKFFWLGVTLTIGIFTAFICIRTLTDMVRTNARSRELRTKIEQLEKKISSDSAFIHQLNTSPDFLEKVAREQYHMQREGETVYILE